MENKKIKNAKKNEYNGINFKSNMECSVYKYLCSIGITPKYELERFTIWDRYKLSVPFYDKYGKTFMRITRKPVAIHYTPDFIFNIGDIKVILEVKGYKNDVTPYKIKLFRDYLENKTNDTKEKFCYAIIYSIKNLKFLLDDLQSVKIESKIVSNSETLCDNKEKGWKYFVLTKK